MKNNPDLTISLSLLSSMPVGLLSELHYMVETYGLDRDWTYLTAYKTKIYLF